MKGSNYFKNVIQDYLNSQAEKDELFAKSLSKENKNIDDCINYILNQVQASGCNGFADEEVFQMAMHYYDEDDLKIGKPINARVVVNHSDFEGKKVPTQQKEQVKERSPKVVKLKSNNQVSLFDFPGV
ncbi:PcfK-like protein [Paenimyroides tangerinum]|uniref:PcfK-like protein n=1 Tax=Paenimyroides tangerinum TaxID=2488728 RepID=A0A3P3W975_9FLAO|nr:PcfK-like family protein [Paenimyroides tangerinum]RRJ91550.1 PcfK-like protein [Paenimyroides tangerinum]